MKAYELMEELYSVAERLEKTRDKLIYGNPEKELKKVAVTCIATIDVIKAAAEWGADLIITHEPTFFGDIDTDNVDAVSAKKLELFRDSDITVYRFHDGMHNAPIDMIAEGELKYLGLKGRYVRKTDMCSDLFYLDEPMSAFELATLIEEKLGLKNVRISGVLHEKYSKLSLCFGAAGGVLDELKNSEPGIVIAGEITEWTCSEYARDAESLGLKKALVVMGHMASEKEGMRFLSEKMSKKYTGLDIKYFNCGDVYHAYK